MQITHANPLISVVMPMHNVESYVYEAIQSVLLQSFCNFELIIIDDGSTDNSLSVAVRAIDDDPRAKIITQKNRGLGSARNVGISETKGQYLYFFDSDDLLVTQTLQVCINYLQNLNLDMIAFSGAAFSSITDCEGCYTEYQKPDILNPIDGCEMLARLFKRNAYSPSACLYICSRSLIENPQLRFDEGVLHEDEGFTADLYCRSKKAVALSARLFNRRIRLNSIMNSPLSMSHIHGSTQAALRIENTLNTLPHIPRDTKKALRSHQRALIRRARRTAENINKASEFKVLLQAYLNVYSVFLIDPAMVLYLRANKLYCTLKQLWNLPKIVRESYERSSHKHSRPF